MFLGVWVWFPSLSAALGVPFLGSTDLPLLGRSWVVGWWGSGLCFYVVFFVSFGGHREGGGVLARSGGGGFVSGIGGSSAFSLDPVRIRFGLVP